MDIDLPLFPSGRNVPATYRSSNSGVQNSSNALSGNNSASSPGALRGAADDSVLAGHDLVSTTTLSCGSSSNNHSDSSSAFDELHGSQSTCPGSTATVSRSVAMSTSTNSDSSLPQCGSFAHSSSVSSGNMSNLVASAVQSKQTGTSQASSSNSNRLVYTSERHPRHSLEAMNSLRKNRELCDVVLLVDGREIYTHRVVLAACSAYFRAMFTGELAESRQTEITLYDLHGEAVETLIDFCYTSQITVEECNVQNLLPAACLLQLTEVQDVCCEFLKRQLDPSNCLGIRAFADTHACRGLLRVANRFTQLNFLEVVESEEFLLLPVNQLVDILSLDELNVRSEEQVYRAAMRWVHHNLSDRRRHLAYLMQHIRLPLLSPKFLVGTVGADLLIRSDERCRDLVDEAKNYLLLPQERPLMQGPRTKPRKPVQSGELLFAVGGWCSGDAIASAEHYDPRTHEWHLVAPMHKRRCGVGVGVVNDLLYAVGGHDGHSYLNSVERYDPHTNQWSSDIAPTSTCRTSVGVAVLNGFMYAVGGQDGVSCLSFVERYDPVVNKWTKVASMASRRLGVGVAVLNGQLYAVGGSDGQQPLASVEHYDPRVGTWHRMSCMGTRRKHLGVAVYNGLIYAVGGRDEVTELSSAECFDPRTRTWSPVVAMTSRRSGVGLTVVNNQLIAIGGFDGATYLKTVELYDPDANCWLLGGSMNSRRLGGGVGVVRLANASWNLSLNNSPLGLRDDPSSGDLTPKLSGSSTSAGVGNPPPPPGLSGSSSSTVMMMMMTQSASVSSGSTLTGSIANNLTSSVITSGGSGGGTNASTSTNSAITSIGNISGPSNSGTGLSGGSGAFLF